MPESEYMRKRREILLGIRDPDPKKEPKPLAKESAKTKAKKASEKKARGEDDTMKERWFQARRKEMTGSCMHCGEASCKSKDQYFRHSIAHILPKSLFESVALHPLNWIELCFWGASCHTNMDNKTLDLIDMNCWDTIVERFIAMYPAIAKEERKYIPDVLLQYVKDNQYHPTLRSPQHAPHPF
jgi:hypothetical protein